MQCMFNPCHPVTDDINAVDEPFSLTAEWRNTSIYAAAARTISRAAALANQEANDAPEEERARLREIGARGEKGV